MFIQTEDTPNPATLKFIPGVSVLDTGTAEFTSAQEAQTSPLAKRLFAVDGVDSCLLYTSPSPRDRTRSRMPSSA